MPYGIEQDDNVRAHYHKHQNPTRNIFRQRKPPTKDHTTSLETWQRMPEHERARFAQRPHTHCADQREKTRPRQSRATKSKLVRHDTSFQGDAHVYKPTPSIYPTKLNNHHLKLSRAGMQTLHTRPFSLNHVAPFILDDLTLPRV